MSTPTFAQPADRAALIALWLEAFDDEPQEVEVFFDRFFSKMTALVMRDNDRIVSMLFLLPATAVISQEKRRVGYIYGGATCKRERGRGHYGRLLSFAQTMAREQGLSALFLHPADAKLDDSYQRMGFTVPLFVKETVMPQKVARHDATAVSAKEYVQMRRRLLEEQQAAYIDWDEAVLTHCLTWCRAYAFDQTAIALISDDWSSVHEYISADADTVYLPTQAPQVPAHWRRVGDGAIVGRLYPLDASSWETPIYMGYGME